MLKSIQWNESLATGIEEIDNDHKKLISFYNDFFAACLSSMGQEVVNTTLNNLIEYTKYHFQHEEELMKKENYPGLAEQKSEHEKLLQTTLELQDKVRQGFSENVSNNVLMFLNNWLETHLMGLDADFAKFVHKSHESIE